MNAQGDLSLRRELDGVARQVEENLPEPAFVARPKSWDSGATSGAPAQFLFPPPAALTDRSHWSRWFPDRRDAPRSLIRPASSLEKSTGSPLSTRNRDSAELWAVLANSRFCFVHDRHLSSRLIIPRTPFIGVRISWLILARNSVLDRLAVSAARRALARARVRSSARADARRPVDWRSHHQLRPTAATITRCIRRPTRRASCSCMGISASGSTPSCPGASIQHSTLAGPLVVRAGRRTRLR